MQDNIRRNRDAVPGLGNLPGLGELFGLPQRYGTKSELVIFLRPTVITNPSLESDELKFYQRFLPQQTGTPAATISGEKTGATQ